MLQVSPFIQLAVASAMIIIIVMVVPERMVSGVSIAHHRLLNWAISTGNDRVVAIALKVVELPIARLAFGIYALKLRTKMRIYVLTTTERTRQRHVFEGFIGFTPGKHSPEVQRAVTLKLLVLAMEVDTALNDTVHPEAEGQLDPDLAMVHRLASRQVAVVHFDASKQAADYFGYSVLPDWTDYISQKQVLVPELATA